MQTNYIQNQVTPPPVVRIYWIIEGDEKPFFKRDVMKSVGAYFVRDHNSWCIDNPSDEARELIKKSGLVLQFRKFKG